MDLDKELQVLNSELEHTNREPYITQKQAAALAILMGRCIKDKKNKREIRLYALNLIAGSALQKVAGVDKIKSTKNLTGTMASVLIDLFLEEDSGWQPSGYAERLIEKIENRFETEPETREISIDPFGVAT
jgi:hypothetical protein